MVSQLALIALDNAQTYISLNPFNAEIFLYKPWRLKFFFQLAFFASFGYYVMDLRPL